MPNPTPNLAAMFLQFLANPAEGLAAREAVRKFQAAQPRWLAAAERATTFRREHPGEPLPSDVAGALSEMIGEAEALKQTLEGAFGPGLPEQTRAGFEGMYQYIDTVRALLRGTES
jgi:hypothetical protein